MTTPPPTAPHSPALTPSQSDDVANPGITDSHNRTVRYLRLSVTDRCNLRCMYCRVDSTFIPHPDVLRYEEMESIVDVAVSLGVTKVRLTGGEPFVRKGFPEFLVRLREQHPQLDLRITSNGVMLAPHAPLLASLGVRVNLSLDTLSQEKFTTITGRDLLPRVLESMDALRKHHVPFKLNAVALRTVNDDELPEFLDLARLYAVDVRFIEFMPMGESTLWSQTHFWPAGDVLAAASRHATLTPAPRHAETDGPARMYYVDGGPGRFGLITPLSNHFCASCNRLRVTSDGRLRTCLFDDKEYRLAPVLRHPRLGIKALPTILRRATLRKPLGVHILEKRAAHAVAHRAMTAIGG